MRKQQKQVAPETTEDKNRRCLGALIGADLRTWRLSQQLSVTHLARIVGVGRSSFFRWELGLCQPGTVHVHLLQQLVNSTRSRQEAA